MRLFNHNISFPEVDPLGGGLAEEIEAERSEPDAITLEESLDGQLIADRWNQAVEELEKDPEWFKFSDDE